VLIGFFVVCGKENGGRKKKRILLLSFSHFSFIIMSKKKTTVQCFPFSSLSITWLLLGGNAAEHSKEL